MTARPGCAPAAHRRGLLPREAQRHRWATTGGTEPTCRSNPLFCASSTAGACARSARATRPCWPTRQISTGSGRRSRIRRCRPAARMSACRPARSAIPRSATPISAPGRVVWMELPKIEKAIEDGTFFSNAALMQFMAKLRESGGTAHLLGLLSPGGVHSHQRHMAMLCRVLSGAGIPVAVHAFLDGRDVPPKIRRAPTWSASSAMSAACRACGSPPSAAASTPWTATSAGTGSSAPSACWPMARGRSSTTRSRRSTRPMPRTRRTSSSSPLSSATIPA